MEALVFRHNGDIILMLDKSTIDVDRHPKQITQLLQNRLENDYKRDWNNIDFQNGGQLYVNHPSYEWYGNEGTIRIVGETYKVRDIMQEVFTVV